MRVVVVEARQADESRPVRPHRGARSPARGHVPQAAAHVLADGEPREQAVLLEHHAQRPRRRTARRASASSQPEQRFRSVVLPQPGRPDDGDELALRDARGRISLAGPATSPNAMRHARRGEAAARASSLVAPAHARDARQLHQEPIERRRRSAPITTIAATSRSMRRPLRASHTANPRPSRPAIISAATTTSHARPGRDAAAR